MFTEIIKFWFQEIKPSDWFTKNDDLDRLIIKRFSEIHNQAIKCELYKWRKYPQGRLAEIIILDQFSRNMFRESSLSFAYDCLALCLSQEAISIEIDKQLTAIERNFLYMPFMHSESLEIHEVAMDLFNKNGIKSSIEYEIKHKEIIEKFGRYPHRNKVLDRKSTQEELEFLKTNNGF